MSDAVDEPAFAVARLSDEMAGSGSYDDTRFFRQGIVTPELSGGYWTQLHQARGSALRGLERMQQVLGESFTGNPLTVRAYLTAGLANRILGEDFCQVVYDGGEPQPKSAAFDRAVSQFEAALEHAQQAGVDSLIMAAHGGLAQAYVGLGQWDEATQEAALVSTSFSFEAIYHADGNENGIYQATFGRNEISAYGTFAATLAPSNPRAPYTDCTVEGAGCSHERGADGTTPYLRQDKFVDWGANIPVIKGTEMRLIEAEAAMRDGDLATFTAKINEVRAYYGLEPIDEPATVGDFDYPIMQDSDAHSLLDRARFLTLWLEGRRLWDLHRWNHPFLEGGSIVYPAVPERASCMPIPIEESQTNPNL